MSARATSARDRSPPVSRARTPSTRCALTSALRDGVAASVMPADLAQLWAAATEAADAVTTARAAERDAHEQARRAPREDQAAAVAAVQSGAPLPPVTAPDATATAENAT